MTRRNWFLTLLSCFFPKLKPKPAVPGKLDAGTYMGIPHSSYPGKPPKHLANLFGFEVRADG